MTTEATANEPVPSIDDLDPGPQPLPWLVEATKQLAGDITAATMHDKHKYFIATMLSVQQQTLEHLSALDRRVDKAFTFEMPDGTRYVRDKEDPPQAATENRIHDTCSIRMTATGWALFLHKTFASEADAKAVMRELSERFGMNAG